MSGRRYLLSSCIWCSSFCRSCQCACILWRQHIQPLQAGHPRQKSRKFDQEDIEMYFSRIDLIFEISWTKSFRKVCCQRNRLERLTGWRGVSQSLERSLWGMWRLCGMFSIFIFHCLSSGPCSINRDQDGHSKLARWMDTSLRTSPLNQKTCRFIYSYENISQNYFRLLILWSHCCSYHCSTTSSTQFLPRSTCSRHLSRELVLVSSWQHCLLECLES